MLAAGGRGRFSPGGAAPAGEPCGGPSPVGLPHPSPPGLPYSGPSPSRPCDRPELPKFPIPARTAATVAAGGGTAHGGGGRVDIPVGRQGADATAHPAHRPPPGPAIGNNVEIMNAG